MRKYEFKAFPKHTIITTLIGLVVTLAAIVLLVFDGERSVLSPLSAMILIGMIAFYVITLAGLSTKKARLVKTFLNIFNVVFMACASIFAIVAFFMAISLPDKPWDIMVIFFLSLLMLVASILNFVYSLAKKDENIKKLSLISNFSLMGVTFVLMVFMIFAFLFGPTFEYFESHLIAMLGSLIIAASVPLSLNKCIEEVEPIKPQPVEESENK